jgi:high-affinity nickel-transport protein
MYFVGVLFAFGFDTATEIGILGISASQAVNGLSAGFILVFPVLFAAGMTLIDGCDGVLMLEAYGWVFRNPLRKLYYNLAITGISIVLALVVGGIEASQAIAQHFSLPGLAAVVAAAGGASTLGYLAFGAVAAIGLGRLVTRRSVRSG